MVVLLRPGKKKRDLAVALFVFTADGAFQATRSVSYSSAATGAYWRWKSRISVR